MERIRWAQFSHVPQMPQARKWLTIQCDLQLADNTITAYGRGLEDYLHFCERLGIDPQTAERESIAKYVADLARRPSRRGRKVVTIDSGVGLSNATMQQRIT